MDLLKKFEKKLLDHGYDCLAIVLMRPCENTRNMLLFRSLLFIEVCDGQCRNQDFKSVFPKSTRPTVAIF